jgi:hypothetical protein
MKALNDAFEELQEILLIDSSAKSWFKMEQIRFDFGLKTRTDVMNHYLIWLNAKAGA